jgi:hypothetical protein
VDDRDDVRSFDGTTGAEGASLDYAATLDLHRVEVVQSAPWRADAGDALAACDSRLGPPAPTPTPTPTPGPAPTPDFDTGGGVTLVDTITWNP